MSKKIPFIVVYTIFVFLAVTVYYGCEEKTGKSDTSTDNVETETIVPHTTSDEIISEIIEPIEKIKLTIPNIKDTWIRTFNRRFTLLNITEQTDSRFSGNISISYRQVIS